ncbi:MAG: alpha-galactosidase, partial [Candidatus Hydrogenedentes bacterium]|nr:alpha-galactosidase [Candidatus Hydrogenedentota bacterium]
YPATDWVLFFENTGTQDTPILEDVQALDVRLRTGYMRHAPVVHELEGDACGERTFHPKDTSLEAGKSLRMAPTGGRPSSISAFPFFNFEYEGRGLITAIGWTGQWAAQIDRADTGPTRLRGGMEHTHFVLRPGERVRTPRIVMMAWAGDRLAAHNRFRRLVLFKYVPQADGAPARLPTALQTFDRYNARPGWATEAGQLEAVKVAQRLGCETYWLDAAWFPGNFPNGVGNWYCKPQEFPNGLKPVGDACKNAGMRFVLWFEPERVVRGTQIAEEHPEFVLGGKDGGLFNLSDPAARAWLTDLLSQRISEFGITLYRNDFNMDPLSYWQGNDAPDRQGISEIRYVEGLYAMWDELLARHPGLLIDNCSSGGRRIDIEMCSRSVPLWRSDTNCSPGHPDWNQLQSFALGQYVPLSTSCVWAPKAYDVRSSATGGLLCQFAYLEDGFPMELASALVAEARVNQPFWYGDFYPLTPCSNRPDEFVAYQLHRPDLGAGVVIAYRRAECNYLGLILGLNALRPGASYHVQFVDEQSVKTDQTFSAAELAAGLPVRVTEKGNSTIIRYAEVR